MSIKGRTLRDGRKVLKFLTSPFVLNTITVKYFPETSTQSAFGRFLKKLINWRSVSIVNSPFTRRILDQFSPCFVEDIDSDFDSRVPLEGNRPPEEVCGQTKWSG